MLAMKNYPQKSKAFSEFLNEVKKNSLRAFDNQDYQFEELIANLDQKIEPGRNPLFDVVLNVGNREHGNMDRNESKNEEWVMESYEFDYNTSKYDLLLRVLEDIDKLSMSLEYPIALFKSSTVEKIAEHFLEILAQVVENKDIIIKNITISYEVAIVSNTEEKNDEAFNF
jgi:non-ribosomal peptide synthetase component F